MDVYYTSISHALATTLCKPCKMCLAATLHKYDTVVPTSLNNIMGQFRSYLRVYVPHSIKMKIVLRTHSLSLSILRYNSYFNEVFMT